MVACDTNGSLSGKNITSSVSNSQVIEEKSFLSTSTYLQYDILLGGDIKSQVSRKDQDFDEIYNWLKNTYPAVIVPYIEVSQV